MTSTGATNGGIITPWGGMPAFTQGMVTRHQFFADTTTTKFAGVYNVKAMNLKAVGYYATYDVGAKNAVNATAFEAKEAGFDFIYMARKDLQVRFRGNFPTDFAKDLGWNEYRFIVNYNF